MDTDELTQELETEPVTAMADNVRLFAEDNFFAAHPDHILGEATVVSGRFGPVTKYKGDLSALERIDAPMDFIGNMKTVEDPLMSTGEMDANIVAECMNPATLDFLEGVNRQSEQATHQVRESRTKKKGKTPPDEQTSADLPELNSFEEIYRLHNPEITHQELEVFIWYKTSVNKPLSRRWINLLEEGRYGSNLSKPEPYEVSEEKLHEWAKKGLVYYFSGKYLPAFLYLSGDIYARKFQLERDQEDITQKFGQETLIRQQEALNGVFRQKYESRLIIGTPGSEDNLMILPGSKFAENFMLEGLESMGEGQAFKIKAITAETNRRFGQPDFLNDKEASERKKKEFQNLSLKDAFAYWLVNSKPEIQQAVTAEEIIRHYLNGSPVRSRLPENASDAQIKEEKAQLAKFKANLQKEGERLFKVFLSSELTLNDKVRLETEWNAKFNNYVPVNYHKVPVAFTMTRFYKGKLEELRPEKREAVAFVLSTGTGCLAYDVGVGKTASAIFTISAFMDAGFCKRPFVCVPNQVYKQFIQEIKDFTPHIPVIEAYNFGEGYIENFRDAKGQITAVPEGCITVMTYEGLEQIGFSDNTYNGLFNELYKILDQGGESERKPTQRQKESFSERLSTLLGKGLRGTLYNIEDFGFDFGCYDEAHKLKKVFTAVKGEVETDDKGKTSRGKNPYAINSGVPSSIGLKAFMLNQYILKQNGYQNVLLLTATPFTNSPLEIFSMLAMLAYEQLQETDLNNIKNFFDTYIQTTTDLIINAKLKPEFRQIIVGFNNLVSLQTLIRRYINYKTGEDVNVQRPNKYVLPYTHKLVGESMVVLDEHERVETYLEMTPQQEAMMNDIIAYAEERMSRGDLEKAGYSTEELVVDEDATVDLSEGEEVEEESLDDQEKRGVRILRSMNFARNLAVSPYLYEHSGLGKPEWFDYVESSPKLKYICECVRSVRQYHLDKSEPISGQVIYMDRGIEYMPLLRQYLIEEVGYAPHEVAIIKSGMPTGAKKGSKEFIKNLFNGVIYNISTKTYEQVPDEDRIKVVIGSSTIKEGMNLQTYSSVLYDGWLDWNPTDFLQLSGRIWRQGNTFNSIRIALPLVVNSMDIFIFQKLQEKTQRLNTIWSTNGVRGQLKLEEIDPAELKYALIRDPMIVAELKIVDQTAAIDGEILGIKRLSERIDQIKESVQEVTGNFEAAVEFAREYRSFESTNDQLKDAGRLAVLIMDVLRKQTDREGKKLVYQYERNNAYGKDRENMSDLNPAVKPYWFDDFNTAQRNLNREVRDFINPNGIPFSLQDTKGLDGYKYSKQGQIEELEARKDKLKSKDNIRAIAQEVIAEREAKKISFKPTSEVVRDFAKLNYLLDDRKVATLAPKPVYDSCPPREDGKLAITDEAVIHLENCLQHTPQTRDLFIDPDTGSYQPERMEMHQRIIAKMFEGVRCVKKGSPIAVFTGGSPGAGKTHFLREHAEYLLSPDVFTLDADEIRAMLPEYQGWNANSMHRESQDIVNELLGRIGDGRCRYDFIYDGTMNKANKYFGLINKAKGLGYKTFIIFVEVPYGVARKRVLERYQKTGRYVPMDVLNEFHEKMPSGKTRGQEALDQLKPVVDGYIVVDGVTGKIKERGGAKLPSDRHYGEFLNGEISEPEPQPAPQPAAETTKAEAQGLIKTLKLSMKYLSGQELEDARGQIKTLELSLKYL